MGHAHSHGEAEGNYFLDQLFTILTCGGIGLVAVLMYWTGMLSRILADMFYVPVLIGGIAILAMALVRAVTVWKMAGARSVNGSEETEDRGHGHSHSEGHEHSHAHNECDHDHAHGGECEHEHAHSHAHAGEEHHDHGWAPWRYMVLAVPIFLYFLGLPQNKISNKLVGRETSQGETMDLKRQGLSSLVGGVAWTKALRRTNPNPVPMQLKFKELSEAAAVPSRQDIYEGNIGILRGQFVPLHSANEFTLLRINRTCCVADEVLLETRIVSPDGLPTIDPYQWVRVQGEISFQKNSKGKWIPVITLNSRDDITTNVEPTIDANIP